MQIRRRAATRRAAWRPSSRGNRTVQAYFGVDGKPTLHKDGFARVAMRCDTRGNRIEYDHYGNIVASDTFGVDGEPVAHSGIWKVAYAFDERENQIEAAHDGLDNRLLLTNRDGAAR